MPYFMISIVEAWDWHHHYDKTYDNQIFPSFKVSNDSDKYLLRHGVIEDCLESDVHHVMSHTLAILIYFIQDHTFL